MPLYRRRYLRRRYPRLFRRWRRGYRRSYARKYVNASSRSSIRMKCVETVSNTSGSGYGTTLAPVLLISPYNGSNGACVVKSPLYKAYRNLYEETKLIGMKVQLSVTSVVGNATLPSLEMYTAWDRRCGRGEAVPTAADIKAMATSNVATALNNNVAKISRSIYASDLMEKAQWHDSSPISAADDTDAAWYQAEKNPNFFCPAFYFTFGSPSLASPGTTLSFTVSVTYYVAFRNPRYGGSGASKDLPVKSVTIDVDDDDGLDDERMVDPAAVALPPDAPGDFPEDSDLTPGAAVARANTAARREAEALRKRSTIVLPRPRVRDPKNV